MLGTSHSKESAIARDLEPEGWCAPLSQEGYYQKNNLILEEMMMIIIIIMYYELN
jgi:hypothetical protein